MRPVRYTADAAKSLRKHANVAPRLRKAMTDYAHDPTAHGNNVTQLVGSKTKRLRLGDYRMIFEETTTEILVTKVGPRSDVYD